MMRQIWQPTFAGTLKFWSDRAFTKSEDMWGLHCPVTCVGSSTSASKILSLTHEWQTWNRPTPEMSHLSLRASSSWALLACPDRRGWTLHPGLATAATRY